MRGAGAEAQGVDFMGFPALSVCFETLCRLPLAVCCWVSSSGPRRQRSRTRLVPVTRYKGDTFHTGNRDALDFYSRRLGLCDGLSLCNSSSKKHTRRLSTKKMWFCTPTVQATKEPRLKGTRISFPLQTSCCLMTSAHQAGLSFSRA